VEPGGDALRAADPRGVHRHCAAGLRRGPGHSPGRAGDSTHSVRAAIARCHSSAHCIDSTWRHQPRRRQDFSRRTLAGAPMHEELLSTWKDGTAKSAIVGFVKQVTTDGSAAFVPTPERIAVFDNDGTLWCEKPMPIELGFILMRMAAM